MATDKLSSSIQASTGMALWLGIAAIVVVLDQLTKFAILQHLQYGQAIPLTSFFNLVLVYNKGAAFSFLAAEAGWQRYLFAAIAAAAAILIVYLLRRNGEKKMFCAALALILGGALGNLVDRVLHGHVIDFLDFYLAGWHWPAFNVADMAICVGAALFIVDELRRGRK